LQTNSSDCGVYAAAYAAELMSGNPPGLQASFDVSKMRQHLEACLFEGEICPFPRTQRKGGFHRKVITVKVCDNGE